MTLAKSALELGEMFELLHDELDAAGFEMLSSIFKIMTSFNDLDVDSLTIRGLNLAMLLSKLFINI